MEEDFDAIITASKRSLKRDKEELEKKSPRNGTPQYGRSSIRRQKGNENDFKNGGSTFNLGGFEKETPKQRQMKEARQKEYQKYLAEKTYRTNGMRSTITAVNNNDECNRNQVASSLKSNPTRNSKQDFRNKIDQEYEELLKKKQKDEKDYRLQFGDSNIQEGNHPKKKVIVFESGEDVLYEFVKQKQGPRGKSAETQKRLDVPRTMQTEGRSNSVPPSVPPIFGGSSQSNFNKEKQQRYKKELEDQIKEKELLKAKDKLKRLGRITSDVDISEIEIPNNDKDRWALPVRKIHNSKARMQRETNIEEESRAFKSESRHNLFNQQQQQQQQQQLYQQQQQPFQQSMMQQPFYPPPQPGMVPMYPPMVANPLMAWQNMMQPPVAAGAFNSTDTTMYPDIDLSANGNPPPRTSGRLSARATARKQWEGRVPLLDLNDSQPEMSTNYIPSKKKNPLSNLPTRPNVHPPGGGSHGVFDMSPRCGDDDAAAKRAKQLAYQEELKRQVEFKKQKAAKEKADYERYQKKLEQEIEVYDPWGRGGCGAPVRNKDGKVVANLRALQNTDHTLDNTPKQYHQKQQQQQSEHSLKYDAEIDDSPILRALAESLNKVGFIDTYKAAMAAESSNGASKMKGATGGATYGRGAALKELKGINVMSPRDKEQQDEYKQYLKEQVEAKKRKVEEAKEKARMEEEREAKRVAEQQKRMQEEYEREKEQQRQKEEEVRKKNEELRLVAEKKRFEEEQKNKKIEEEYQAELRQQAEMRLEHHNHQEIFTENVRSNSPPVPAVAKERRRSEDAQRQKEANERPKQSNSQKLKTPGDMQYLESIRHNMEHQAKVNESNFHQQKQLINQLSALREQLQKQEMKIQEELHHNKVKYTELNKDAVKGKPRANDIFAKATKKTSKRNIADDNMIISNYDQQYQNGTPTSSYKVLDLQQQDYMRQQEERLNNLKKSLHQKQPPSSQSRGSAKSLLDSDSKFISLRDHQDITSEIKGDGDNKNTRYSSARSRRRVKESEGRDVFQEYFTKEKEPDTASIATYRVEEIAERNEQRLRQYNVNSQENEAEDIVQRFMDANDRSGRETSLPSDSRFY